MSELNHDDFIVTKGNIVGMRIFTNETMWLSIDFKNENDCLFRIERKVSLEDGGRLSVGQSVRVAYNPLDPWDAYLADISDHF